MNFRHITLIVTLLVPAAAHATPGFDFEGNVENGRKLYEAKCVACHISLVGGDGTALHTRPNRRIKTGEDLITRVQGCNHQIKAGLTTQQINDIIAHLYKAYYKQLSVAN